MDSNQTNVNPNPAADAANSKPVKTGPTALSIVALIFSFICAPVGFILSIIDLFRKHGRKKFLSVIALVLSTIFGLVGGLIVLYLVIVMAPQVAKYTEQSYVSSDMQLCNSVRTALVTCMMDPAVITDPNPGIPAEGEWIYVEDIDPNTAFGKDFEEMMGMKATDVEDMIQSSYMGDKAKGMRFRIENSYTIYVEIQYSDSTGQMGKGDLAIPISVQ